jgi:type IV pilus assembly protein PilB
VSRDLVLRLGFTEEEAAATTFYRPVGCINCTGGFKGRLPLHEALDFTPEVREIVLWSHDRLDAKDLKEKAIEQGMVTLTRAGTELLKRGLTTLTEVAAALA